MDPRGTDPPQFLDQNNELSVENECLGLARRMSRRSVMSLKLPWYLPGAPGRYDFTSQHLSSGDWTQLFCSKKYRSSPIIFVSFSFRGVWGKMLTPWCIGNSWAFTADMTRVFESRFFLKDSWWKPSISSILIGFLWLFDGFKGESMVKLEHMEPKLQSFLKKFGWSEYLHGIVLHFNSLLGCPRKLVNG